MMLKNVPKTEMVSWYSSHLIDCPSTQKSKDFVYTMEHLCMRSWLLTSCL